MTFFGHEEPKQPAKPCKFLSAAVKDAFAHCHIFRERLSSPNPEEENPASDIDDDEQEVIILAIRNQAMEAKLKRKAQSLCWVLSPTRGDLFIASKGVQQLEDHEVEDEGTEAFFSVESYLSRCSSASREAFLTVGSCLSRCSSASSVDYRDLWRRSIIQELCHCEGWPFGLCRKALLLPPLPRSPSDSWLWRRGTRIIKMP